mmetsp:Transcript_41859/g.95895  ORF Transcript_41859/g.95895 Transcript_41859/m.95895 type:complete len:251 (-) Transcript_41859:979-1731(-)
MDAVAFQQPVHSIWSLALKLHVHTKAGPLSSSNETTAGATSIGRCAAYTVSLQSYPAEASSEPSDERRTTHTALGCSHSFKSSLLAALYSFTFPVRPLSHPTASHLQSADMCTDRTVVGRISLRLARWAFGGALGSATGTSTRFLVPHLCNSPALDCSLLCRPIEKRRPNEVFTSDARAPAGERPGPTRHRVLRATGVASPLEKPSIAGASVVSASMMVGGSPFVVDTESRALALASLEPSRFASVELAV